MTNRQKFIKAIEDAIKKSYRDYFTRPEVTVNILAKFKADKMSLYDFCEEIAADEDLAYLTDESITDEQYFRSCREAVRNVKKNYWLFKEVGYLEEKTIMDTYDFYDTKKLLDQNRDDWVELSGQRTQTTMSSSGTTTESFRTWNKNFSSRIEEMTTCLL